MYHYRRNLMIFSVLLLLLGLLRTVSFVQQMGSWMELFKMDNIDMVKLVLLFLCDLLTSIGAVLHRRGEELGRKNAEEPKVILPISVKNRLCIKHSRFLFYLYFFCMEKPRPFTSEIRLTMRKHSGSIWWISFSALGSSRLDSTESTSWVFCRR